MGHPPEENNSSQLVVQGNFWQKIFKKKSLNKLEKLTQEQKGHLREFQVKSLQILNDVNRIKEAALRNYEDMQRQLQLLKLKLQEQNELQDKWISVMHKTSLAVEETMNEIMKESCQVPITELLHHEKVNTIQKTHSELAKRHAKQHQKYGKFS